MKILYINDYDVMGGAETHVKTLMNGMGQLGHEVRFYSEKTIHIPVHEFNPDIIHYHNVVGRLGIDVIRYAAEAGIPFVVSLHDYWCFCWPNRMMLHNKESCGLTCDRRCGQKEPEKIREILADAAALISFNSRSQRIFKGQGFDTVLIRHGIDTKKFSPGDRRVMGNQKPRILFINAVPDAYWKGEEYFDQVAASLNCESVKVMGEVKHEQMPNIYREADIYIHPSYYNETFGLTTVESMSSGCVVVVFDVGGAEDIIGENGKAGFRIESKNVLSMIDTVDMLTKNPDMVYNIGRKARERVVKLFDMSRMITEYDNLYRGIAWPNQQT